MKRRDFLKALGAGAICAGLAPDALAGISYLRPSSVRLIRDSHIKDYIHKMRNFDKHHVDDVFLPPAYMALLESTLKRLKRLQRTVGHGNFHLLNFDSAIKFARNYSKVGRFTKAELDFLEKIFYEDGTPLGFFGEKPFTNITDKIRRKEVTKVRGSGNYLYKGPALDKFLKIKKDLGDNAILTSGIRGVVKQFILFLNKAYKNQGNLSLASRSLAPPGYSFHSIGDFDIGQVGYGVDNFTDRFATTEVYNKLVSLGYVKMRYERDNMLGVRFEPWHIKVV